MRCDLHVHSVHSGPVDLPLLRHFAHESYSEPGDVFATARARGMDFVTLTDHDTISGALAIAHRPEVFVGEEVTVVLPGARVLHVCVWGIEERDHERIGRLRLDPGAFFFYLAEHRLPAALNHPFSALTGRRELSDIESGLRGVGLVEARNGMMPPDSNAAAMAAALASGRGGVGGSDAHTLAQVAHAYTEVPGARTKQEFLEGLRAGLCVPAGGGGSWKRLARDIWRVTAAALVANVRNGLRSPLDAARLAGSLLLLPLTPLVPLIAVAQSAGERRFAARYFQRFTDSRAAAPRAIRVAGLGAQPA
jgi:predicted metal-dependent phosphoesterase TrpH